MKHCTKFAIVQSTTIRGTIYHTYVHTYVRRATVSQINFQFNRILLLVDCVKQDVL